jgi:predicted transglutaminase-like cysteine proteinase
MRFLFLFCLLLSFIGGCCTSTLNDPCNYLWKKQVKKLYNWIPADAEALKYAEEEPAARKYLQDLRAIPNIYAVSSKLLTDGFYWHSENVDFVAYPWVTIAGKRGDCDDFMALWESVLKYQGQTQKVHVESTEGGAHAMLLFWKSGVAYILSNLNVLGTGSPGTEESLIRLFYKDKTKCFVRY